MFFLAPLLASIAGPAFGLSALQTGLAAGLGSYALNPKDPGGALLSGLGGGLGAHFLGGAGGAAKGAADIATKGVAQGAANAASSAVMNHGAKAALQSATHALPQAAAGAAKGGIGSLIKNPWLIGGATALAGMGGNQAVSTPADSEGQKVDFTPGKKRQVVPLGGDPLTYGQQGMEHSFYPEATQNPANPTDWIDGYPEITSVMRPGGIYGLRNGGKITGPGGPKDDMIPAVNVDNGQMYALSNGEVVLNAGAAKHVGYDKLAKLNKAFE